MASTVTITTAPNLHLFGRFASLIAEAYERQKHVDAQSPKKKIHVASCLRKQMSDKSMWMRSHPHMTRCGKAVPKGGEWWRRRRRRTRKRD